MVKPDKVDLRQSEHVLRDVLFRKRKIRRDGMFSDINGPQNSCHPRCPCRKRHEVDGWRPDVDLIGQFPAHHRRMRAVARANIPTKSMISMISLSIIITLSLRLIAVMRLTKRKIGVRSEECAIVLSHYLDPDLQ